MNTGSYVFAQMVKFLDEFVFLRIVKKYDGGDEKPELLMLPGEGGEAPDGRFEIIQAFHRGDGI